jgi:hypothetical protein
MIWLWASYKKNMGKKFCLHPLKSIKKGVGSGSGSRAGSLSISQRYGSGDLDRDPHQNVTDPEHFSLDIENQRRVSIEWNGRVVCGVKLSESRRCSYRCFLPRTGPEKQNMRFWSERHAHSVIVQSCYSSEINRSFAYWALKYEERAVSARARITAKAHDIPM